MGSVHYKITLTYNGSAFAGFQRQKNKRTVQGVFENCLRKLGWQEKSILGAGRTDAGVHAKGQVVSFHLAWQHSEEDLQNALNYYLPQDMAVHEVVEVPEGFHPRFDAKFRRYRYDCFCQPVRDPLREVFAWRVWPQVDVERMNAAAQSMIGVHDFSAFGGATSDAGTTLREVFLARWQKDSDQYQFVIEANAFLYHMVRRITFLLVTIGQNEAPVGLIEEGLSSGNIAQTGLAPAQGLVLEEVCY